MTTDLRSDSQALRNPTTYAYRTPNMSIPRLGNVHQTTVICIPSHHLHGLVPPSSPLVEIHCQDLDTALSMPILINFFLWDLRLIRKGEERNLGSKALCTGRLRLAREFCWMRVRLRKSEENLDKGRDTIVFACHNDFLFIFYKLLSLLNLTG